MNKTKMILNKLIHPKKAVLIIVPTIVFAMLIFIFATKNNKSMLAYSIYFMSAYSLAILIIAIPKTKNAIKNFKSKIFNTKPFKKLLSSGFGNNYINNAKFRGRVSIYQGIVANFLYATFRILTGIKYASIWFISMANIR